MRLFLHECLMIAFTMEAGGVYPVKPAWPERINSPPLKIRPCLLSPLKQHNTSISL